MRAALFLILPEQCMGWQMIAQAWATSEEKDRKSMERNFVKETSFKTSLE